MALVATDPTKVPVTFWFIMSMDRACNKEYIPLREYSKPFESAYYQTKYRHILAFHKPVTI